MTLRQTSPASDYETVRAAIRFLSDTPPSEVDLPSFARDLGYSQRQLTELFRRWCGLTPNSFAHAVALDHAKSLLAESQSILDTTYELGLSSPGRLHDLFVTHEAMPPGVWRDRGEGLAMTWGAAPSPFGTAIIVLTDYGIAGIGFADGEVSISQAFQDLRDRWPNANYARDDAVVAPVAARIFDPQRWNPGHPVRVVLIGTDFNISVWETLLKIPLGRAVTYSDVAKEIGRPTAQRAVGSAVGRNPISFVVPCHRVVGRRGALTGYHWGLPRKRAILGWEAGIA
jgi:AraC family transcriptional regulator, regulatory protein of adaptative response / methylated-DNA-[protein]-cysteine methyltransferase